ncbi:MAG: hypothetical protein QFC55_07705, partial [Chloroflexota bacterium]|nr:hypothetical protein [Chloroflexota bacterium]
MLRARTRVSLASLATLAALLAMAALAQATLADEPGPTPLPEAVSGPSVDTLLALASGLSMECITFTGVVGEEYSCHRQVVTNVYYSVSFPAVDPLVLQAFVSGPLPWPEDHDQFFFDFADPFCDFASTADVVAFIPLARDAGADGLTFDDRACRLASDYNAPRADMAMQQLTAWAKVDPATLPTPLPTALPTAPPPLATPTPTPSAA